MVQVIRERKPWQISCDPRGDARRAPQHMRFLDQAIVWALSLGWDAELFASADGIGCAYRTMTGSRSFASQTRAN